MTFRAFGRLRACVCLLALGIASCGGPEGLQPEGPTGTVSGKVTRKGAPLTSGTITFANSQKGLAFTSAIGSDGSYSLSGPFASAVPVGDYQVAVAPTAQSQPDPMALMNPEGGGTPTTGEEPAAGEIPLKFRSTDMSGITKTVAEGANDITVDIPE